MADAYDWQTYISNLFGGGGNDTTPSVAAPPGFGITNAPQGSVPHQTDSKDVLSGIKSFMTDPFQWSPSAASDAIKSGGKTSNDIVSWFDATRIVTVILGLILFGAGVFLLGRNVTGEVVKGALKDAVK